MSNLYQRRYLNCPYKRAKELLAGALSAAATSADGGLLRLRLPVTEGAALSKDVLISIEPGNDPMHFDQVLNVRWEPAAGGLYPSFAGTLAIRADERYETSILELVGAYQPPLGAVGAAFDTVVGSRIAHATARELLRAIGGEIEDRFRQEEAAKPLASGANHDG